jgi:hypothetical protein
VDLLVEELLHGLGFLFKTFPVHAVPSPYPLIDRCDELIGCLGPLDLLVNLTSPTRRYDVRVFVDSHLDSIRTRGVEDKMLHRLHGVARNPGPLPITSI